MTAKHILAVASPELPDWSEILLHLGAEGLRPNATATEWKAAAASFFALLRRTHAEITIVEHRPAP
jgi:hypothetical protein